MKVPSKVRVGPFTYRVVHDHTEMNQRCRDDQTDLLGQCEARTSTIYIEPKQSADQKRDTLLHELLHALADLTGVGAEMNDDAEEQLVRRLSPAILALLRDNKKLVAFLVAP